MLKVDPISTYTSEKIIDIASALDMIEKYKRQGKTVGLCHGGFDLTHPGHVKHFEMAKKECDVLFVSVTCDKFVTSRKGSGRPIYTDKLRAYIIAGIGFVDHVVITDFRLGIDVIKNLKPSFYIKGPDFVNKQTPGITSEREAIKDVGGEMRYTTERPMSTTDIIRYIKDKVDIRKFLICIDRDGTIIENADFLGKNKNWKDEVKFKDDVISFISYLQTRYKTTNVVVTNQNGVARRFFDCDTVEQINRSVGDELTRRGIKIDSWQYCPNSDKAYADAHPEYNIDPKRIMEKTKRKPNPDMVYDAMKELGKDINDFDVVLVLGDSSDDAGLAKNLGARYIDVNGKNYDALLEEFS